jgi:hypothetical protein
MPHDEIPPSPVMPATGRDAVLKQAISFDPARWRGRLPDPAHWPAELDSCVVGGNARWPKVDRKMVFDICRTAREPAEVTRAFVAACVWGAGTGARSVHRCVKVFENSPEAVGERLAEALAVQRDHGPVEAYAALRGRLRVRWLGPAFFTKLLYFAGYDSATTLRPLILDRFVAVGTGLDWRHDGWSSEQYGRYLRYAHHWAETAETGTSPDAVEFALFKAGKVSKA